MLSNWMKKSIFFVFLFSIGFNIYHLQIGISNPLRELEHGFRQCQTAISTYWLLKDGFKLDYETPILGPDWRLPIEFASFQYSTALVIKLFDFPLDITGRLVSIFYFYAAVLLLFFILKELKLDIGFILLALSCVLINPNYCFWPRAYLYESTALCLSLGFVLFSLKYFNSNSILNFIITVLFGIVAAPTKITTFLIYLAFIFCLFVLKAFKKEFENKKKSFFISVFLMLVIPIIASSAWNNYADSFKLNHLIASNLSTQSHVKEWVFWNFRDRFSFETWNKIIPESMFIVKLFPLLLFLFNLKYWKQALLCIGFWLLGPLLFTRLYYVHAYYNTANGFFLGLFIAFILYSLLESDKRILQIASVLLFCVITYLYQQKFDFYFSKSLQTDYDDIFFTAENIKKLVKEDETFIIYHADWNAELPYYSQRKAIMIPGWFNNNEENLKELVKRCGKTKIAGIAVLGDLPSKDSETYQQIKLLGYNPENPIPISQEGYWWHWYGK